MIFSLQELDRNKITSESLKEYLSFKDNNIDYVILFQIGNFYETFFEDAKILSNLTGLTLGSRNFKDTGNVAQCGFNISNDIHIFVKELLDNGYKVCLCKEHKVKSGKPKRELIRRYTKGTIIEDEFLELNENNYILVLNDNGNNLEMAYADVSTGQFYKTSGTINEILLEIQKIEPSEIIIFEEQLELFEKIIDKYHITILDKKFKSKNTEKIIEEYCKHTQKKFCAKLDNIIEYNINKYLTMDEITRRNLELTKTKMFLKKKGSLFWFLNNTKTPMGTRLLKKYISEPLMDIDKIKQRQKAIEELIHQEDCLQKITKFLENFCDLSRICARLSNSTIFPRDLYRIAKSTQLITDIDDIFKNFNSSLLKINENKYNKILKTAKEITESIKEDAPDEITSGNIIKENYNPDLDYNKLKLEKVLKEIKAYENKERKRLGIEKLKIDNAKVIGYYIEIPNSKEGMLSNEYIRKQRLSNISRYTTEKLTNLENELNSLKFKTNQIEHDIFCTLRDEAKKFVETIRQLAQDIAKIDVLTSLAICAKEYNFSKPNFNKEEITITQGYHPSLIKLKNEITKNDTNIPNGTTIILTGANMSGKSTYLKHNAIICLLAQMGSFVPAQNANITLTDKIFFRQGATDDIISNNSSFMVEMNDFKFIIDNITNSSFVLLDEPAKSTNAKEGGAIARAFCEYLINHYSTKTIIATHNFDLTKLEQDYPQKAINFVIGSADVSELMPINRKLRKGIVDSSLAINTAILAQLPDEIIEKAKIYSLA